MKKWTLRCKLSLTLQSRFALIGPSQLMQIGVLHISISMAGVSIALVVEPVRGFNRLTPTVRYRLDNRGCWRRCSLVSEAGH